MEISAMQRDEADPDIPLIHAIAEGDTGALHTLYARHGLHLLNYLIAQLGDRALAEEVLQDVMLAAWRGAGRFRGGSLVRTWLFAIAWRQALKARGRSPMAHLPLLDHFAAETEIGEPSNAVEIALQQLPPEQQEALELVFYRGLSGAEAAALLGIPLNTFKSRLHRAKAALRHFLQEDDNV
jgi:RNA polymerase sigma-70 factor (ECF subfamily)